MQQVGVSNPSTIAMSLTETQMERSELQGLYIQEIIDGMDLKDCLALLHDYMDESLDKLSSNELIEEIKEYYPHLLEE